MIIAVASHFVPMTKYIFWFAQTYEDFRLPELDSLLVMNGLDPTECYDP